MKGSKIFKAAFIVMIISIISRFLGLFRDMLVSYQFGMNMYTDAYKAAEMFKFSNNIISILLVISIIAFSLGFAFTREIVSFMFDGFSNENLYLQFFN